MNIQVIIDILTRDNSTLAIPQICASTPSGSLKQPLPKSRSLDDYFVQDLVNMS